MNASRTGMLGATGAGGRLSEMLGSERFATIVAQNARGHSPFRISRASPATKRPTKTAISLCLELRRRDVPQTSLLRRLRHYRDGSLASRCPFLLGAPAARRPPDVAFTPPPPLTRWLTRFAMPLPARSSSGATSPRRRFYAASAVNAMAHSLRDAIAHADVPKRRLLGACRLRLSCKSGWW